MDIFSKTRCALAVLLASVSISVNAQDRVTIVDRPAIGSSDNYTAFRAPLSGGRLLKLPVGAVRPQGWLREVLLRQRDGLNGQLGTVSAWLDKQGNQWLSDQGDHGWEEVPYWLRGYCSLAYILDDDALKQEAQTWFEGVLTHLKADGFLGPRNTSGGRPEVWAQMIMLWALQTYYEYSGDERVLTAMTNYMKWELSVDDSQFLEDYWENKRGGDNEWSVIWLYNRTGNEELLPLIEKLHRNTSDWTLTRDLPNWHGVNVAQGFREPATYYVLTGDEQMLQHAYDNHFWMRERYGQVPGGMFGADENAREGYSDPRQGAETCAIVEQMASDEIMLSITGDPFWADHLEDVAFNTLPAALTADMRALRYITSPNMTISDGRLHGPSIDNDLRGMLSMSPFSSRCCQHNHGMGWPYLTEHLVMATGDDGLAAMVYLASETTAKVADGRTVRLTMDTHYPFEENIQLTIHTEEPVEFPLYMRIPAWAKEAPKAPLSSPEGDTIELLLNGAPLSIEAPSGAVGGASFAYIKRTWHSGDVVTLRLPMTFSTRTWQANKSSVSVDYGPLTLSLRIDERYVERDSRDHEIVQDDSHWQAGVDASLWPAYEIFADSPWNYALEMGDDGLPLGLSVSRREWPSDNYPFTPDAVPLTFTAKGRQVPSWGMDATGMTAFLPTRFAARSAESQPLQLVPMGAARLRITAFPKADVNKEMDDCY